MKISGIFCLAILLIFVAGTPSSFAQSEYEDVVYLKNGGVRRGMILEQVPNEWVKLKTSYGEIFIVQMSDISKIVKEEKASKVPKQDHVSRKTSNVLLENWYTYWGLGYSSMTYTEELNDFFVEFETACPQCDKFSMGFDFFGFYRPLDDNQTLVGVIYNASGDRYTNEDRWMQATSGQFSISTMHFIASTIGDGPFIRADIGYVFLV